MTRSIVPSPRRARALLLSALCAACGGADDAPAAGDATATVTATGTTTSGAGGAGGAGGAAQGGSGQGGAPACPPGQAACAGVCTPLDTAANCGACGVACGVGALCCASACVTTDSCAFAVTSVDPPTGWLNGGARVKLHGEGFAKGATVLIGGAKAPARVVDANTIQIFTPPNLGGPRDVTVSVGGKTTTLAGGFTYMSGGLEKVWQTKKLTSGRIGPLSATLPDGRVLVAGGLSGLAWDSAVASADLYTEPEDSAVLAANAMATPRFGGLAVPLLTDKVLVVGGACQYSGGLAPCMGTPTAVDLFDPATSSFAPSKAATPETYMAVTGTLLADGRVLLIANSTKNALLYDPEADTFAAVAVPVAGPNNISYPFVVRMRDGRVLVGSGDIANVSAPGSYTFVFDPATDTFAPTGPMVTPRSGAGAVALPDGRVLLVGGSQTAGYTALDTIEIYDPATGTFSLAPYKLSVARAGHATVMVRDGTVLAVAGISGNTLKDCITPDLPTATIDRIDPVAGAVSPFSPLPKPASSIYGVVTLAGSVFVAGGAQCGVAPQPEVHFLRRQ